MSVTVNMTLSGDLDNPRHRKAVQDIADAVQSALEAQEGIGYISPLHLSEVKTFGYQDKFSVDGKIESDKMRNWSHNITLNYGFHLNPIVKE